jgi:hypothetical protein
MEFRPAAFDHANAKAGRTMRPIMRPPRDVAPTSVARPCQWRERVPLGRSPGGPVAPSHRRRLWPLTRRGALAGPGTRPLRAHQLTRVNRDGKNLGGRKVKYCAVLVLQHAGGRLGTPCVPFSLFV